MMYVIRHVTERDAYLIASIHVASWQKIYRGHIPDAVLDSLSVEKREDLWRELIRQGTTVLLIEKNNKAVGFVSVCASRDSETDPKICAEISAIYIHPDFWYQGLGKKLCAASLTELMSRGFTETILWVLEENTQARKFYEAMGFTSTEKIKVDTLKACTLGVVPGEEATENATILLREIQYHIKLHKLV